mgnify:CR=1 FL=1
MAKNNKQADNDLSKGFTKEYKAGEPIENGEVEASADYTIKEVSTEVNYSSGEYSSALGQTSAEILSAKADATISAGIGEDGLQAGIEASAEANLIKVEHSFGNENLGANGELAVGEIGRAHV